MHCKVRDVLRHIQELHCLREFVVSSDPRSAPKTAKKPFFLKSHLSRWLLSLGRGSQLDTELMTVDTLASRHWVDTGWLCSCAQQVVGADIGTETQCLMVVIIRGNFNITLSLQKRNCRRSRALLLGSRTRSRMTNSLCLKTEEDLYCEPLTSQYRALQFV